MLDTSREAQLLYQFLKEAYIRRGYVFSGAVSYSQISIDVLRSFDRQYTECIIQELLEARLIQRRDGRVHAYELTKQQRKQLLLEYDLVNKWASAQTSSQSLRPYINIHGEAEQVLL
ncbi:hypothetical protein [Aneurinibacillus tyrosinisolvens]|uniref:hypothetical protein n=1 Tax=Aneurinibacillus tyrosinisolvens TaxID=1443435 RepID=UPI00063FC92F|nr:hypothetical protein [Aneurinibacillus tyrosinisolvens]